MSRVGLVTTFRFVPFVPHEEGRATFERCWSTLSSFLLFHLAKGMEHVFLYADADDGSNEAYIERIGREFHPDQVSVDIRSESQRERQQASCRLWRELGPFSGTEVPARQSLNAEDAMRKAGEMGLDWLLHLDIDELFYTSETSIRPHFEHLTKLGVEQMTYANHEAVPSREDVGDYFREVSLFRVNHLLLPLSRAVGESTRFWRRRRSHGQYMLAYDNGKAAVRVLPGKIVPQSVHRWRTLRADEKDDPPGQKESAKAMEKASPLDGREAQSEAETCGGKGGQGNETSGSRREEGGGSGKPSASSGRLVNRFAMPDPRELRFEDFLECQEPYILHYPSCGLDWLRDKYRLLGRFPSSWFGGRLPIAPCFHLDARNAVHENEGSIDEGASEGAEEELYRKEVMLCPEEYAEEINSQLEHGVLRVITGAGGVIERALSVRGAPRSKVMLSTLWPMEEVQSKIAVERGALAELGGLSAAVDAEVVSRVSKALSTIAASGAAEENQLPNAGLEGDATGKAASSSGFENSWILAACARDFL